MAEVTYNPNTYVAQSEFQREADINESVAGGSWLYQIAKLLGQIGDKMAQRVVDMAKAVDKAGPEAKNITELNAKLNAATQVLNMFLQAVSNIIKTIGEGEAAVARKN